MKVTKLHCENTITFSQIKTIIEYLNIKKLKDYSPYYVERQLKANFDYISNKYLIFNAEQIWKEFIVKNFSKVLESKKITSIDELIYRSEEWRYGGSNELSKEQYYYDEYNLE